MQFAFFFSSRRRHTRWPRDWSSDVCSSDLPVGTSSHRHLARADQVEHSAGVRDHVRQRGVPGHAGDPRSEERRVGKEWRSRWAEERKKMKKEESEKTSNEHHTTRNVTGVEN